MFGGCTFNDYWITNKVLCESNITFETIPKK